MSLDLSASDINQLQGPSGQVPYAKAINALKKRFDILPTDRVKNASTKKKVKDRQAELLRTLRASGQDTLARQFAAAFKDPKNLHGTSQQAINTYLDSRLKDNPSIASVTAPLPYNLSGTPQHSSQPPVQASGPASVPDSPLQSAPPPTTPQATPQQQYASSPTEADFIAGFTQQQQTIDEEDDDVAFGDVSEVEPTDEPASEPTTTPSGEQVVEQLQKSMAKASDLVEKTAAAVDASAKETTNLRETVGTTTKALQALVDAKNKTENASPAMSAEILAQVQGDPALAKLVSDGLLKWDDMLGPNPPEKDGDHVAGYKEGDTVIIASKLQRVIDNLQSVQVRESASLTGAIEVNRAARTTTGFRPSDTGYFAGKQVWMPIRAPPPSLPGRR